MQLEIRSIILIVIIVGNFIWQFRVQQYRGLIRPTPCHIANSVPPSPQHQRRHIKGLGIPHTLGMTLQTQIKAPQSIPRQRIGPALQHDRTGTEHLHNLIHDGFEYLFVRGIRHARREGSIDGKPRPFLGTRILDMARAWEEVSVLVQTERHDAVGAVKCLLDAITVMHVNVNIKHSCMNLEQFQYSQYDIINVTKSRCLAFLRVMQPSTPINGHVAISPVQFNGTIERCSRVQLREFVQPIKHWTIGIFPHIELLHLIAIPP
mmetsp:Transcript_20115/g.43677  ORF Transcript_20115/g.43677 Transcript_20115/m.43677 type:complete len:263 (-) Transcript_20115:415-1203(-)